MNIEFLKWMVEYAQGFRVGSDGTVIHSVNSWELPRNINAVETWEHYPLLLQRAREGVDNKTNWKKNDREKEKALKEIWKAGFIDD